MELYLKINIVFSNKIDSVLYIIHLYILHIHIVGIHLQFGITFTLTIIIIHIVIS